MKVLFNLYGSLGIDGLEGMNHTETERKKTYLEGRHPSSISARMRLIQGWLLAKEI